MKYFQHDTNSRTNRKLRKILRTHGPTGYAIWWAILEELYMADELGFEIKADELWLENFAESLCISDYRTLIRVLDTFAEVGLISRQHWAEHYLFIEAIHDRGDNYIQKKAANAKRQARFRGKKKEESCVSNALRNAESNDVTLSDPDPDPDPNKKKEKLKKEKAFELEKSSSRELDKKDLSQESVEDLSTVVKDLDDPHPNSATPLPRDPAPNVSLTRQIVALYETFKPNGWVSRPTVTVALEGQIMRALQTMPEPGDVLGRVELALRYAAVDFGLKQRVGTLDDLFKYNNLIEWSDKGRSKFKPAEVEPVVTENTAERHREAEARREKLIELARLREAAEMDWVMAHHPEDRALGRRKWAYMKDLEKSQVVSAYREKIIALGVLVNV